MKHSSRTTRTTSSLIFESALLLLLLSKRAAAGFSVGGTFLSATQKMALMETAAAIGTPGKGITNCDEGPATVGTRFEKVGISNSEETRRAYRQMLFEATGCETYLSAAILDPETIYQRSSSDGKLFPQVLSERGIVPGVKLHLKTYTLPGTNGDTVMQGLDSLNVRCQEYYAAGARFAKWRSPITIDVANGCPSDLAIRANVRDLARYALICQSEGLMPFVEPDIALTGSHSLEQAVDISIRVQSELFKTMIDHGVHMAGAMLKSNIVNPGQDCRRYYSVEDIADANIFVLEQSFPVAMKGCNYLSEGQTLEQVAARLSAINKANRRGPWNLSFSLGQALQQPLLELCRGTGELQLDQMSTLYVEKLKIASAASLGEYEWNTSDGDHKVTPLVTNEIKRFTGRLFA